MFSSSWSPIKCMHAHAASANIALYLSAISLKPCPAGPLAHLGLPIHFLFFMFCNRAHVMCVNSSKQLCYCHCTNACACVKSREHFFFSYTSKHFLHVLFFSSFSFSHQDGHVFVSYTRRTSCLSLSMDHVLHRAHMPSVLAEKK